MAPKPVNDQVATKKRKRTAITCPSGEELDQYYGAGSGERSSSVADFSSLFYSRIRLHKESAQQGSKIRELAKTQNIAFTDLSAELRNNIYELALTNPDGLIVCLSLYARTKKLGHFGSVPLVPNLLQMSKQIYSEAINYLYGQKLCFGSTPALECFLVSIGSRNHVRLRSISLREWPKIKTDKSFNFALLQEATNLRRLYVHTVRCRSQRPGAIAAALHRHALTFFKAYGGANGRKDAAAKIVDIGWTNFYDTHTATGMVDPRSSPDQIQRDFAQRKKIEVKRELGKLLIKARPNTSASSKV